MKFKDRKVDRVGNVGSSKSFRDYLKEAMEELEKENWNYEKCRRAVERTVSVVIDNTTEEAVKVRAGNPETALAQALSKLTPGVKTIVEEA